MFRMKVYMNFMKVVRLLCINYISIIFYSVWLNIYVYIGVSEEETAVAANANKTDNIHEGI